MNKNLTIFVSIVLSLFSLSAHAISRGESIDEVLASSQQDIKYHALIIGINDYEKDKGWYPLAFPESDANRLVKVLKQSYGFDDLIYLKGKDATKNKIESNLTELEQSLGPNDALLIFYAGHGHMVKEGQFKGGYWVPTDGTRDPQTWVSADFLHGFMQRSAARHVLLMSDSCYAGAFLTRGIVSKALSKPETSLYRRQIDQKSRYLISSGNLEEVPDRSFFTENFLKILEQAEYPYVFSAENIYFKLQQPVFQGGDTQVVAKEMYQGGAGGNFIFIQANAVEKENMLVLKVSPASAKVSTSNTNDHVRAVILEDEKPVAEHRIRFVPSEKISLEISNHGYIEEIHSLDNMSDEQRHDLQILLREWSPDYLEQANVRNPVSYETKTVDKEIVERVKGEDETWRYSEFTAAAISPTQEYFAVSSYTRDTHLMGPAAGSRLYSSSILIKDKDSSIKELKCYLPIPKEREERSSRKIRDVIFLPPNERYLVALSGDHLFLWDSFKGRLLEKKLLPDALKFSEKANLVFYRNEKKEAFVTIAAQKTTLPDYKLVMR